MSRQVYSSALYRENACVMEMHPQKYYTARDAKSQRIGWFSMWRTQRLRPHSVWPQRVSLSMDPQHPRDVSPVLHSACTPRCSPPPPDQGSSGPQKNLRAQQTQEPSPEAPIWPGQSSAAEDAQLLPGAGTGIWDRWVDVSGLARTWV